MEFLALTEAYVATWHAIAPANDAARRMAADIELSVRAFERVRDRLRFEDEPSDFAAALLDEQDRGA